MVTAVSYKSFQELPAKHPLSFKSSPKPSQQKVFQVSRSTRHCRQSMPIRKPAEAAEFERCALSPAREGAAVRIDAVFNIQAGQIADKDVIRVRASATFIKGVPAMA